jgi:hypothetical protein
MDISNLCNNTGFVVARSSQYVDIHGRPELMFSIHGSLPSGHTSYVQII